MSKLSMTLCAVTMIRLLCMILISIFQNMRLIKMCKKMKNVYIYRFLDFLFSSLVGCCLSSDYKLTLVFLRQLLENFLI